MHSLLLRQLKRAADIADAGQLQALLTTASEAVASLPPDLGNLLQKLGPLLERVSASYEQYDRDLALRSRSLELSSEELNASNARLREELDSRQAYIVSMRDIAQRLLHNAGSPAEAGKEDSLESLTTLARTLIDQQDVQRKQLHTAMQRLEQQKFALDEHAIVSITDLQGNIVYANDKFCEISGYAREELLGKNHRLVNSGTHPAGFFRDMWETICAGRVWRGEVCNRNSLGGLYWVNATVVPLLDEHGLPHQYIGIRTDITARKQAEAELDAQLHFQKEILDSIPIPVYFKDTEGCYLGFNQAFTRLFHINQEEWLGRSVFDLLPEDQARDIAESDVALFTQGGRQSFERQVKLPDGSAYFLYYKAALTRPDGSISGIIGTLIDISERKALEESMRSAKEAAEAANRAKSDFLANMSHEIRTPMNGIIGMTELALDTDLSSEQRDYLETVKNSADALLTIINDILDFSKIEAGKLSVEHIPFHLGNLLSETLRLFAVRADQKGIELLNEIAPETPQELVGDPGRLRQVLNNLLGNAIKFTPRGEIVVRVSRTQVLHSGETELHFEVRDTGIGIPAEKVGHIFEAFAQEDTSTTRRFGGTGLGLTISKRLVQLMGGRIWVDSTPDVGSTFHFTVLLGIDHSGQYRCTLPGGTTEGKRVLVVDDNEVNRRILRDLLQQWGMTVDEVANGAEALVRLEIASNERVEYDLILLDAHMPALDGFDVAGNLQTSHTSRATLMMLSSADLQDDLARCRELGISAYLTKPVTQIDLMRAIRQLLNPEREKDAEGVLLTRNELQQNTTALRILVAEDHPANQRLILTLLNKWGHLVELVDNGEDAIARSASEAFDLVLMDMQMPGMGGLEATRRIRARETAAGTGRVPIYAVSAAAMVDDQRQGMEAGLDGYLTKPIRQDQLLEVLERYAGRMGDAASLAASAAFDYRRALAEDADPDIVEIIGPDYLECFPADAARLRAACAALDWESVSRSAHTFKGNVGNFAAARAEQLAFDLEQASKAEPVDAAACAAEVEQLLAELERFNAALTDYMQEKGLG